jgi:hypothetical protein
VVPSDAPITTILSGLMLEQEPSKEHCSSADTASTPMNNKKRHTSMHMRFIIVEHSILNSTVASNEVVNN